MNPDTVPNKPFVPKKERVLEFFPSKPKDLNKDKQWFWRMRSIQNGKITQVGGEGYSTKSNLLRAFNKESTFWKMECIDGPIYVDK